jgi:phage replication initiation protein
VKKRTPSRSPVEIEASARLNADDFRKAFNPDPAALDILRQIDEAQKRKLEFGGVWLGKAASGEHRPQRSEDGAQAACPPPANRGGKVPESDEYVKLVLEDGVIKEVLKRRGYGGSSAFVDWLNFTVGAETFEDDENKVAALTVVHEDEKDYPVLPVEYIYALSRRLQYIFGFGVSHALGYGQHFYTESFVMAEGWGTVSFGGQRNTMLVSISGKGLAAAKEGWEARLVYFLEHAQRPRITRADLAHDFFNEHVHGPCRPYHNVGYTVDRANEEHSQGLFSSGGRPPACEHRGDWKNPRGKGRTLNIGNRKNGKFCRIYEKGKEQGDKNSPWVRVEVELKSVDRIIPFDILTRPGEYLATQYPALFWISEHQERILTTQKTTEISVERAVAVVKHQFGAYINFLADLFGPVEFVDMVRRADKEPTFSKVPHYGLAEPSMDLQHIQQIVAFRNAAQSARSAPLILHPELQ